MESSKVKYILNLVVGYFLPVGRSNLRPDHPTPGRSDLVPDHPAADVFLPRFSGKIRTRPIHPPLGLVLVLSIGIRA
jgi:hypothetical protein